MSDSLGKILLCVRDASEESGRVSLLLLRLERGPETTNVHGAWQDGLMQNEENILFYLSDSELTCDLPPHQDCALHGND